MHRYQKEKSSVDQCKRVKSQNMKDDRVKSGIVRSLSRFCEIIYLMISEYKQEHSFLFFFIKRNVLDSLRLLDSKYQESNPLARKQLSRICAN